MAEFKAEHKILALFQLIRQGQFDLVQHYLDTTKFAGGSALDAQFIQAQVHKAKGRLAEAAAIYRNIIARHPDQQETRVQLAHTLYLMKEDESARHHFQLALASVTNRDLESNIRNFIDQMDQRKRWHVGGYVSLAPSTNLNQGTDAKTIRIQGLPFSISEESRRKSGVGLLGGVNAGTRTAVTDKIDLVTGAGFNFKKYADTAFDDYSLAGQVGPRYNFTFGHVGLYATVSQRWHAQKSYSTSYGARTQLSARMTNRALLSANVGYAHNIHDTATHFDGDTYYGAAYVDYFLSNTTYARWLATANYGDAGLAHLDHYDWSVGAGYYTDLTWGLSLYTEFRFTKRQFDGDFPGMTTGRSDHRYDLTATLTKRDWNWAGFAPKFEYGFTHAVSNVVFYDHDAHSFNVTLTKQF